MSIFIVGVDPGLHTAVTILDATAIVTTFHGGMDETLDQLAEWVHLNRAVPGMVAVEKMFSPEDKPLKPGESKHRGGSKYAAMEVAEHAGEAVRSVKMAGWPGVIKRPYPQTWRSALGITGKGRDAKEAQALEIAGRAVGRVLKTTTETDLAESYCIAQWAKTEFMLTYRSPLNRIHPR